MSIESDANDVMKFLAGVKQSEDDPNVGRYELGGAEILKWLPHLTAARLNDAVHLLNGKGYIMRHAAMGTRPFTFLQIGINPAGRVAIERAKADAARTAAEENAKASRLRGPWELEPNPTADDREIIDVFEQEIIDYFVKNSGSTTATFTLGEGGKTQRRHLAIAVDELREVGWIVKPNARQDSVFVERSLKPSVANASEDSWSSYATDQMAELVDLLRRKMLDEDLLRAFGDDRAGRPCAVVMFDIDHFKKANDTLGHPGADKVLIGVAKIIREVVGRRGRAYRYGGEEISVLLPDFTTAEAAPVAERCRKEIELREWENEGLGKFHVTISVGVSSAVAPFDAVAVLKQADDALNKSKSDGRNRVTTSDRLPT